VLDELVGITEDTDPEFSVVVCDCDVEVVGEPGAAGVVVSKSSHFVPPPEGERHRHADGSGVIVSV
jgi:hypothetical protein